MTTVILVLLTVLLVVAAAYVGLLLLRRSRPAAPAEAESAGSPQTVGDLVAQRTAPEELSGDELFDAAQPKAGAAATPVAPVGAVGDDAARSAVGKVPQPVGTLAMPPEGLEAGDAPWRRAARMRGDEPGAAWDTAPIPVVEVAAPAAATVDGRPGPAPVVEPATETVVVEPVEPVAAEALPVVPALVEPPAAEPVALEPASVEPPAAEPVALEPASVEPSAAELVPAEPVAVEPEVSLPADTPSHPLSDPEMTPLMGIPIVRPAAAEAPLPDVAPADLAPADAEGLVEPAGSFADPG